MLERILNAGIEMNILWGIGLLGLIIKLIANIHMSRLLKASENMVTTKRKSLRVIRQKYENGRALGANKGTASAFVEKNVRRLKLLGLPLSFYGKTGTVLSFITVGFASFVVMKKPASWRGSPEMLSFLGNMMMLLAFLMVVENIFFINNKLEMLKANISDYLENMCDVGVAKNVPFVQKINTVTSQQERSSDRNVVLSPERGNNDNKAAPVADVNKKEMTTQAPNEKDIEEDSLIENFLHEFFA